MSTFWLYLITRFVRILPETRLFGLKAGLYRLAGARVERDVRICSSATLLGNGALRIGAGTWVGHDVRIASGSCITIGRCVDIGPQVFIGTGTHVIDPVGEHSAGPGVNLDVTIGDGVWLGARCMILPGVTVGRKAVVAAGSVVTRDVPEMCLVAGVPAVVKKHLNRIPEQL